MSIAVNIEQLNFAYNATPVLKDIGVSLKEGEYVAVIGANGAGKSTLIKCINRILTGWSGSMEIFGRNIKTYSQKELGRIIGYVPQTREQAFAYTVHEFVLMGRYPYLSPLSRIGAEDRRIVDESLDLCGIADFRERMITRLSGGERQKVYLAAALAQRPRILLLDEPTAHLDPKYHMEIQATISRIAKDMNMAVLHVTHDLNHLLYWGQKILALKEGRIVFFGAADAILEGDHLRETFDTHFMTVPHPGDGKHIIVPEVHG